MNLYATTDAAAFACARLANGRHRLQMTDRQATISGRAVVAKASRLQSCVLSTDADDSHAHAPCKPRSNSVIDKRSGIRAIKVLAEDSFRKVTIETMVCSWKSTRRHSPSLFLTSRFKRETIAAANIQIWTTIQRSKHDIKRNPSRP